jgi:hypothetical protein
MPGEKGTRPARAETRGPSNQTNRGEGGSVVAQAKVARQGNLLAYRVKRPLRAVSTRAVGAGSFAPQPPETQWSDPSDSLAGEARKWSGGQRPQVGPRW